MSTPNNILSTISDANGEVMLAVQVAGVVIPLVKAAVTSIKQIATGGQTVSYAILLQVDGAELDAVDKLSMDDLSAINAELVKLGRAPIVPPTQS